MAKPWGEGKDHVEGKRKKVQDQFPQSLTRLSLKKGCTKEVSKNTTNAHYYLTRNWEGVRNPVDTGDLTDLPRRHPTEPMVKRRLARKFTHSHVRHLKSRKRRNPGGPSTNAHIPPRNDRLQ